MKEKIEKINGSEEIEVLMLVAFENEDGNIVYKTLEEIIEMKFMDKKELKRADKILVAALMQKNNNDPIAAFKDYVPLATEYGYNMLKKKLDMPDTKAYIIYTACLLHFHLNLLVREESEEQLDELMDILIEHIE